MANVQVRTIKLLASLRVAAGAKTITVFTMLDACAGDLLAALRHQHPALADRIMDADGQLQPGVLLLINGRHMDFLQGAATPLRDDDDWLLMPPIAGG